jgi:hypothetical protein
VNALQTDRVSTEAPGIGASASPLSTSALSKTLQ